MPVMRANQNVKYRYIGLLRDTEAGLRGLLDAGLVECTAANGNYRAIGVRQPAWVSINGEAESDVTRYDDKTTELI